MIYSISNSKITEKNIPLYNVFLLYNGTFIRHIYKLAVMLAEDTPDKKLTKNDIAKWE